MKTGSLFLLLLFLLSCNSSRNNTMLNPTEKFDTQGHRGCRGLAPENTWAAMKKALDLGVVTLEMDAVITKDKQVILSHEPFFNHEISTQPGGSGVTEEEERSLNIYQLNYEEVKKYDVGLRPHPRFPEQEKIAAYKPLLADIFDSVKEYLSSSKRPFPYFNIETKSTRATDKVYHPEPDAFVTLLMNVILEKKMEQWVIIQSFDIRTLQYLHTHYPAIQTALLIEGTKADPREEIKQLGFTPGIYSPDYQLLTKEAVNYCHQQNIKVIPWTVNDKATIDSLKKMGVDGIISDYPNLFN